MSTESPQDDAAEQVTVALQRLADGDDSATDQLFPYVYDLLRRLAGGMMQRGRSDHTLQPTALVHEVFVKVMDVNSVRWQDRAHFLNICAQAMRQILINHARDRAAKQARRRLATCDTVGFLRPVAGIRGGCGGLARGA